MKLIVTITFLFLFSIIGFSQSITYNWNSFTSGANSYTNTQGGGCTMSSSISGSNFNGTAPRFDNAVGTNGTGLFLDHNWTNLTNETVVTSNFSPALSNPSFSLFDINRNPTTSDFCSNAWTDSVFVSAVGATGVSVSQSQPLQQTTQIVGTSVKIVANALCNQATQGSVTISFTGPVTQITIKYLSGRIVRRCSSFSPCGAGTAPTCPTPVACTDPGRQFITIGNITGTSCCTASSPPTSISGSAGPFCGPTTTTLTAAGAFANSQWHTGSCTGPIIGTGTSIVVTPAVTTTYYVNNLDCNNNPTTCVLRTVTITPNPTTPTITNTGLSICAGNTTTLTSSSATGNTWSTGSTAQSIVVSAAGTYTLRVSSGGCLSNPASVTVNTVSPPPTPTITAGGPTTFCAGGSVVLSSSNASGNTWNTGATTQTILVTASGNYSVTSGSGSCTSSSSIFTVSVLPNPATPTITSTGNSICAGQSATLTSSSASGNTWSTGATTQVITVSSSGVYSLSVTGANGCNSPTTTVNVTVSPVQPTPTISANGPTTFCAGGSVVLNSSNATGNTWNTGATTQTILVTSSGNYSVVSGAGTCSVSSTNFSVTVLPIPTTPSITSTGNSICAGETATLTSSSTTGNTWSNGSTAQTTTVNATGTYSLFIAGANGCNSPTTSVNVNVTPVQPTPTITANGPANFCAGGSVVLTSSNATNNTWSTGATTQTILVNASGNYSVVSGVGTCSVSSANFNVTVFTLPNTPTITTSGNNLCSGQTATLTSSNTTNNVWSSGETTQSILVTSSGTYSLSLTDANNCSSPTTAITITISTNPITLIVPPNVLSCNGAGIPVTNFTANVGNAIFSWNNNNTDIGLATNGTGSLPSFTATNNGINPIDAVITVTPSADGCNGAPGVFTITVNPAFIINAGVNDTLCFGESTTLAASPNIIGYSYNWQPALGLNNSNIINPIANPTTTTNYSLTVTDANGCTARDEVILFVNSQITSVTSSTLTNCFGSCDGRASVTVSGGNAPYQYTWSNGTTNALNTTLCAANYSVSIRDSWNCRSTNSVTVSQPTQVVASITSFTNTLCFNDCNGAATGTASGGTGSYVYNWNTTPIQINSTALNLCAGIYKLRATDVNGCRDSINVTVSQPSAVNLTANPNVEICIGANTTLTTQATGGTPNYTYNWAPSTGLSNPNSPLVISSPSINTVYTITATDANGCLSNAGTVTVTIKAPISVSANSSTICLGNSTPLTASVSGGNAGSYTYNWSPSNDLTTNTNQTTVANPTTTTIYEVTVNDGCSPTAVTQVTVSVLPLPVVNITATNTAGCAPLCVNLNDASSVTGSNIVSWQWTINGIGTSTVQNSQFCFDNDGSYNITLTTTSADGCISTRTFSNYVVIHPNPIADFTAPETVSVLTPEVIFTDLSIGATTWFWNFNDPFSSIPNQTSTQQNPSHFYSNQGTYCVNLSVTNSFGCTDFATKCIKIEPEFTIYVPNAFTPDDDNLNDFFTAFGVNIIEFEMYIFDRWGEQIFYTNDIKKGWNGTAKGGSEIAKQDIYVWKIKAKDVFNKTHSLIGHVTLLKKL